VVSVIGKSKWAVSDVGSYHGNIKSSIRSGRQWHHTRLRPGGAEVRPDSAGYLSLTAKGVLEDFAQDLPVAERRVLAATQGPTAGAAFGAKITMRLGGPSLPGMLLLKKTE
jgi:hypothetical protein